MRIGVFTALFQNLPFEEALDKCVAAGVTAVEIGAWITAGANFNRAAGLADDPEANARFRRWFGKMLGDHLQYGPDRDA